MNTLVSIADALRVTLDGTHVLDPVVTLLDEALGCVLAESVSATENVPPFANSAMDGFAVRSADTQGAPVHLTVIDSSFAGRPSSSTLGAGDAIRIMTGAVVPAGADAVCMVELTRSGGPDTVVIERPVPLGQHVRPAGGDLRTGDDVFAVGEVLSPAHLGVLASLGRTSVLVHPRPRVGVLSTGDELTEGPGDLDPGAIRDSNRHVLLGMVRASGFVAVDLGIVPDDREQLRSALDHASSTCDAVLTSGGVSVGDADLMKEILKERCGSTMHSLSIAVRPAKPFAFGVLTSSDVPVFGLPGNPVSSLVSFELFARPALRQMAGHAQLFRMSVEAVTNVPMRRESDAKVHVVSVRASIESDGRVHISTAGVQASHVLSSVARANALALVPDAGDVEVGGLVSTMLIDVDSLGCGR